MMSLQEAYDALTAEGSPFALNEIEVRGVPMRIFAGAPPTMRAAWEATPAADDVPYIVYEDETYTYGDIRAQVRSLAHALVDTYGVVPGDRVAVSMRNYPEWVVAYWASVSIGAALVGMNAWWTAPEMIYGLGDSSPKVLIVDDERLERALSVLSELRESSRLPIIATRTERALPDDAVLWSDVVDEGSAPATLPEVTIDPDDDATIFYTSGTTGFPKGAQLTHRGSVMNVMNLAFMAQAAAMSSPPKPEDASDAAPSGPPVYMAPTPLFHVTACNCVLHGATLAGGKLVFMRKWDPARALELIERERVTNLSGVPTMSRELLAHPDWETRDTSSMVGLGGGGAQIQPDLVHKIDEALGRSAPTTGYGLTETHGIVTANGGQNFVDKDESCGRIVPTLDSKLIDVDGNDLAPGPQVTGELCVRGSVVIKGYLNKPEATADAIRDGWFHTGDIARIDEDGFVFIVDRAKDMVIRGGENIYCSEVESAIYEHPDVVETVVFSVPDERLGEEVGTVIVASEGSPLDPDGLRSFLDGKIAAYKVPTHVWFWDKPLPRNASGKFVKRSVRAEVLDLA